MLPGIFLGGTIMFGSFCSIASPFLDVLEQKLAEEVQENGSDEGESGNEEEMDTGEEDLINYRKCISGEDFGVDDFGEENQEKPQGKGEEDSDNDNGGHLFSDEED